MVIVIKDYVKTTYSYEDGLVIFQLILYAIRQNEQVQVDFRDISSIPSSFVNSAFVQLLEKISFDQVRENLTFINSTKQINELIRSRFRFVVEQKNLN